MSGGNVRHAKARRTQQRAERRGEARRARRTESVALRVWHHPW
jgi:hypothetical protein